MYCTAAAGNRRKLAANSCSMITCPFIAPAFLNFPTNKKCSAMFNQTACQYFAMDIHCKFCICLLDKYFCKLVIFLDNIFVVVPDMFFFCKLSLYWTTYLQTNVFSIFFASFCSVQLDCANNCYWAGGGIAVASMKVLAKNVSNLLSNSMRSERQMRERSYFCNLTVRIIFCLQIFIPDKLVVNFTTCPDKFCKLLFHTFLQCVLHEDFVRFMPRLISLCRDRYHSRFLSICGES